MTPPRRATLVSILFSLPFFVLNNLAGQDNEAFDTLFRSVFSLRGLRTNPIGHIVAIGSILLIPIGSIVALRSAVQKQPDEKRRVHVVNLILGAVIMLFFMGVATALITEVYRCDVLLIPKCD